MARNRAKQQGTAWETELRLRLSEQLGPMAWDVERLADGGMNDQGDLLASRNGAHYSFIIEAKDMMQGNIHKEVELAVKAAGTRPSAVIWKRRTRKEGNTNRTQTYPPIVAMTIDEFTALLKAAGNHHQGG